MFVVESYAAVRRFVFVEGHSRREAAREFGLSRNTVSKMCRFSLPPGYTRKKAADKPKLGPLLPVQHRPDRAEDCIRRREAGLVQVTVPIADFRMLGQVRCAFRRSRWRPAHQPPPLLPPQSRDRQNYPRLSCREIPFEIVTAADPLALDEYLWRRRDALLFLEGFNLIARPQDVFFYREAIPLQQLFGAYAERAGLLGQDHAIKGRGLLIGHRKVLGGRDSGIFLQSEEKSPSFRL
jgi:hypothetical protein